MSKYSLFFTVRQTGTKIKSEPSRKKQTSQSRKKHTRILVSGCYGVQPIDHFLIGRGNRALSARVSHLAGSRACIGLKGSGVKFISKRTGSL